MMDLDEVYNSTIKKTQSLLESKGIALSLREIKKLDTINLSGFRNDGERLLRLELAEKYMFYFIMVSWNIKVVYLRCPLHRIQNLIHRAHSNALTIE